MRLFFWIAFVSSFLFSPLLQAQSAAPNGWIKLLRYRPTIFGTGWRSDVDDPHFFLTANGRTHPFEEFEFTRQALKEKPELRCQFPARALYFHDLDDDEKKAPLSFEGCRGFGDFKTALKSESISLIFSSYYLNNPSSAFGHIFLRFNQAVDLQANDANAPFTTQEYLDHSVDFAASVDTPNAMLYAMKGLFGFFKGVYSIKPYFTQVKKYSSHQFRDLWSYQLKLTPAQKELLIAHLWEVGQSYFYYYYLDKNCAYQILAAIESAVPEVNLMDQLTFYVLPVDTVKILDHAKLLEPAHYRPSIQSRMLARAESLTPSQQSRVRQIAQGSADLKSVLDAIPETDQKIRVLDTALDLMQVLYAHPLQTFESAPSALKRAMALARAELKNPSPPLTLEAPTDKQPGQSHWVRRAGLYGGYQKEGRSFTGLRFRFALHDFLDATTGLPNEAAIEFLATDLRFYFENKKYLKIENINVLHVSSFSPWNRLVHPYSWKMRVGVQESRLADCPGCEVGVGELAGGVTLGPLSFLGNLQAFGHPDFEKSSVRISGGPVLFLRWALKPNLLINSSVSYSYLLPANFPQSLFADLHTSWSPQKNWMLEIGGRWDRGLANNPLRNWETLGAAHFYF